MISLREAAGRHSDASPDGWPRIVRQRSHDLDLGALDVYTSCDVVPAPLNPVLATPTPRFEEQVEAIRSTSPDEMRAEIAANFGSRVPAVYAPYQADATAAIERLCRALTAYWERVLRPLWPLIRGLLEREVLLRSYRFLTSSTATAMNELHPAIHLDAGGLALCHTGQAPRRELDRRELWLVPTVGGPGRIAFDLDLPNTPWVAYSVAGSAAAWGEPGEPRDGTALEALLGTTRARLLSCLAAPAGAGVLEHALGVRSSALCAHLLSLRRTGLIDQIRMGRRVVYRVTSRGEALIDLLGALDRRRSASGGARTRTSSEACAVLGDVAA